MLLFDMSDNTCHSSCAVRTCLYKIHVSFLFKFYITETLKLSVFADDLIRYIMLLISDRYNWYAILLESIPCGYAFVVGIDPVKIVV